MRGWNLKRVINNRLGIRRADDKLPKALLTPSRDGGSAGYMIEFEAMLNAYYTARRWYSQSGIPKMETLIELGLDWVIEDLWPES